MPEFVLKMMDKQPGRDVCDYVWHGRPQPDTPLGEKPLSEYYSWVYCTVQRCRGVWIDGDRWIPGSLLPLPQARALDADGRKETAALRYYDADEYQARRAQANGVMDAGLAVTLFSLGIAGEAGEVADYMKKVIGHGKKFDATTLTEELGDVLWYVSQLAWIHGITMSEIMRVNEEKLRKRYPGGFKKGEDHA